MGYSLLVPYLEVNRYLGQQSQESGCGSVVSLLDHRSQAKMFEGFPWSRLGPCWEDKASLELLELCSNRETIVEGTARMKDASRRV